MVLADLVRGPATTIQVRRDAGGGVLVAVAGTIGRHDAAVLSRRLHTELDAAPTVLVVDLGDVDLEGAEYYDPASLEVLARAHTRARQAGIGLHVLSRGHPTIHRQLAGAASR